MSRNRRLWIHREPTGEYVVKQIPPIVKPTAPSADVVFDDDGFCWNCDVAREFHGPRCRRADVTQYDNKQHIDMLAPLRCKRTAGAGHQAVSVDNKNERSREASSLVTTWVPTGYYKAFCAHDRAYTLPCGMCRRSSIEAKHNLQQLINKAATAASTK